MGTDGEIVFGTNASGLTKSRGDRRHAAASHRARCVSCKEGFHGFPQFIDGESLPVFRAIGARQSIPASTCRRSTSSARAQRFCSRPKRTRSTAVRRTELAICSWTRGRHAARSASSMLRVAEAHRRSGKVSAATVGSAGITGSINATASTDGRAGLQRDQRHQPVHLVRSMRASRSGRVGEPRRLQHLRSLSRRQARDRVAGPAWRKRSLADRHDARRAGDPADGASGDQRLPSVVAGWIGDRVRLRSAEQRLSEVGAERRRGAAADHVAAGSNCRWTGRRTAAPF